MMDTAINNWSNFKKIAFRFWTLYFLIYILSLDDFISLRSFWDPIVTFTGRLLKVWDKIIQSPNGSGDTTYNYLQILCVVFFALCGTIIWSALDRKRTNYDKLSYWFRVMLRYVLAFYMVSYGTAKIFMQQFIFPGLTELLQPLGNSSPMGLAWNFMGYSYAFNLFTGLAEAIGGLLVVFRRTATFGALFSLTVLSNVVAMNFCYDIPVKLFSMHLWLMALFIALPDMRRLIDFFFLNRAVAANSSYPVFKKKWSRVTRITLKTIAILGIVALGIDETLDNRKEMGLDEKNSPLYGIYDIQEFVKNSATMPPLTTDTVRWRQLVVEDNYAMVKTMSDKKIWYSFGADTVKKMITLTNSQNKEHAVLQYQPIDSNHLEMHGILFDDTVSITLKKKNLKDFLLVSRGFHWVNEYPFNR